MTTTSSTQAPAGGASADADLSAGEQVGEYVVEGKLGQGGFGAVFKAAHPLIGKVVAIKVLARKFSVDPEMVARFVAEARAVNQIRHRNIIDIFSFGQLADGRHYYVMEYLEGEPLDALVERDGALAPAVALPILRQVARALDAAHAKGIAHRDLKPENVFLGRDADGDEVTVKLLDFGIAKLLAADDGSKVKTRTGIPIGTPYYMSPEQCRGKDVDHRTDYYAFGIVAYRLLTGTYPIDAEDYMSILMKQMSEEPRPPSQVNPALPPAVDEPIAWLMKKDPGQRPPSLAAAVTALEQSCEAGGIRVASGRWDTPTPPPRTPTPPPGGGTAPTLPAQRASTPQALAATHASGSTSSASTPQALAATMPSGSELPAATSSPRAASAIGAVPAKKSPLPWLLAGAGALAIGSVVFVVMRGSHEATSSVRPEPAVAQPVGQQPVGQQPVATPPLADAALVAAPAVVIDAGVAVAAPTVDAAPATHAPATHAPATHAAATHAPSASKKPHAPSGPTRPASHDSHSIEDPFAK